MGHIVFAAPSISSFFLHYRLRKDLLRRGHRVSILCTDRARFTFWREQVSDVDLILPIRDIERIVGTRELVDHHLRRGNKRQQHRTNGEEERILVQRHNFTRYNDTT